MVSYGNIASIQSQSSLAVGQAQANSMGLGQTEANALGVTNLMGGSSGSGLIGSQEEAESDLVTKSLNVMNQKQSKNRNSLIMSQEDQVSVLNAGMGLNKGGIMNTLG